MTHPTNPTPFALKMLTLNDGYVVPSIFYDRIKKHVQVNLSTLSHGKVRSLKQICCPTFWNSLSVGDCVVAGRCVSNMVTNNELPLISSPQKQQYPKKYCRI